jgi:hypothetical protein
MYKLAIVGGRDFDSYELLEQEVDLIAPSNTTEIVSGGAKGADSLGEWYAVRRRLRICVFQADWDLHGKSAGYKRNTQIVDYCDGLIAFWDTKSKGTKHSIDLATKANKLIKIVYY